MYFSLEGWLGSMSAICHPQSEGVESEQTLSGWPLGTPHIGPEKKELSPFPHEKWLRHATAGAAVVVLASLEPPRGDSVSDSGRVSPG